MKKLFALSLFSALCLAPVHASAPMEDEDDAVVIAYAVPKDHISSMRVILRELDAIKSVLDSVKNQHTADAAARKLPALFRSLSNAAERLESCGEAPASLVDAMELLDDIHEQKYSLMLRRAQELIYVGCYGSPALQTQVKNMF